MKNNKRILILGGIFISTIIIVGCVATKLLGYMINPEISPTWGLKVIEGLTGEARIYRDKWGIPHIVADDAHDLFFAVGYAQAQDRLFQMYMFKYYVAGRLAELLGNRKMGVEARASIKSTVDIDKANRTIGFGYLGSAGAELMKKYRPDTYTLFRSYSKGVNTAIKEMKANGKMPLEFKLLSLEPEEWQVADSIAFHRYLGWSLSANMTDELLRFGLIQKFGIEKAMALYPKYQKPLESIPTIIPRELVNYKNLKPIFSTDHSSPQIIVEGNRIKNYKVIASLIDTINFLSEDITNGMASNNWVLGPQKSKSGKPILANDPHLGHMLPSIFWVVHLLGAGIDCYGAAFPGMPFIVLGHNRHVAWGLTTSNADVQDIFIEKLNPHDNSQYEYKGKFENFAVRKETIKIRKSLTSNSYSQVEFEIKSSRHGPIINPIAGITFDAPPLALRWTGYDFTNDVELTRALTTSSSIEEFVRKTEELAPTTLHSEADAIFALMRADNMNDVKEALKIYGLPNQNWVFVDDSGNFGYTAAGRVPAREYHDGTVPVEGWSGKYDWTVFIPFEHLPQVYNPERGYIATANNEVVPPENYPYPFSYRYVPGYRAARIEELLKAKEKLDINDMVQIQNDIYMIQAKEMVPLFLKAIDNHTPTNRYEESALREIKKWAYQADVNSVGCTIFHEWRRQVVHLMLEDELEEFFEPYINIHYTKSSVENMIFSDSPFFDNINTPAKENRQTIIKTAFVRAIEHLTATLGKDMKKWAWGNVHTITFANPIAMGPLKKHINYGPLPHPGTEGTVRNASFNNIGDTGWQATVGACLRHIIDMADVGASLFVIDGGESGQWRSTHYLDGTEEWYHGRYLNAIMDISKIAENPSGLIILKRLPSSH